MTINITIPAASATKDFKIGLSVIDGTVNWGDGTSDTYSGTSRPTHTYSASGSYSISVTGTATSYTSSCEESSGSQFITAVGTWGELIDDLTNITSAFNCNTNLTQVPSNLPTNITSLAYVFRKASIFNQDISSWDTSNITNFKEMFSEATSFNRSLNSWNLGSATNISWMFYKASNFNGAIANWDTSRVTDMSRLFFYASAFNQPIGSWNTSNVTDMQAMFSDAETFNQDISNWDTSSVTKMNHMFWHDYAFNQPIGSWNTSHVTTMYAMFDSAKNFNQSINNWNISNVTTVEGMFASAAAFNQDLSSWNVTNVISADRILSYADSFSSANYDKLLNGWGAQNVASNVSFRASSKYTSAGATGRNSLINKGWTITDGGLEAPAATNSSSSGASSSTTSVLAPTSSSRLYSISGVKWPKYQITPGETLISGKISPATSGVLIELKISESKNWKVVNSVLTDSNGNWTLTWKEIKPGKSKIRIYATSNRNSVNSMSREFNASSLISISAAKNASLGQTIGLNGNVKPNSIGVVVRIQQKIGNGKWVELTSVKTDNSGNWNSSVVIDKETTVFAFKAIISDERIGNAKSSTAFVKIK